MLCATVLSVTTPFVKTGATGMIVQAATRKMRQRMPPNEGRMKIARELVRPVGEIYGHGGQRR
jgi:hypothetical protein